jgi:hypothetical protein
MIISNYFHILYDFLKCIDHEEMLKFNVGRIMTKFVQHHSVWTSHRASYPTLLIHDEILWLSWMQCDL